MSKSAELSVVNIHAAKTHLSRLVERAHRGEEIILAKAGKPYARLLPLAPPLVREFGFLVGQVQMNDEQNDELVRPLGAQEQADWE
ncbi:type II toxin-antitoxin system Phd/YefM family antitoxin [Deinococcus sp.]|uniref:type II toxin-antitoxin system Phd/YefM family antitoxin n=1 Tax=Deinococcus sp. TaxID=47478 RepID=UPI003CC5A78E